jgi:hypothetical protein
MLRHLTLTGFYAGAPICGSTEKTPDDAHACYAPIEREAYRKLVCPACLRAWADAYEPDEIPTAPQWIQELRKTPTLNPTTVSHN